MIAKIINPFVRVLFLAFIYSACTQTPTSAPETSSNLAAIDTPTATITASSGTMTASITPTNTATSTPTPTSTPTLTPTITNTPTPIPSPTPAYNIPGYYYTAGCTTFTIMGGYVDWCVTSVEIRPDKKMKFNVSWTVRLLTPQLGVVTKRATNAQRMYLTDSLWNTYRHVEIGGCAKYQQGFSDFETCYGWFLFPPAEDGAYWFQFHDDSSNTRIEGLSMMYIPMATPTAAPTFTPTATRPGSLPPE